MSEGIEDLAHFVAGARSLLVRLAREAAGETGDAALVTLAGHLYVVGTVLSSRFSQSRFDEERLEPPQAPQGTLAEVLHQVATLPESITGRRLFWLIVDLLKAFEEAWMQDPMGDWLPISTQICGLEEYEVQGFVYHWLRPPSAMQRLRKVRFELAATAPPPDQCARADEDLECLCFFWNSDALLPPVARPFVSVDLTDRLIYESADDARSPRGFRIALCPLVGGFRPRFELTADFHRFQGQRIEDGEACNMHLHSLVRGAAAQGIHLLLLPELMVDPDGRSAAIAALRGLESTAPPEPYGVVAGSFHVIDGRRTLPANESVVLDRRGRTLLRHHKRGRFRVTRKQLAEGGASQFFANYPTDLPAAVSKVVEEIDAWEPIRVLETALGRLMIAICADCIALDDTNIMTTIHRLRPDFLLLVSMTPETPPFELAMEGLAARGTSTLFVNAACILQEGGNSGWLASAYLALYEPVGAPPTRVGWRQGSTQALVRFRRSAELHQRDWHAPSSPPQDVGVDLLRLAGEPVGLVLDLGPHFRWRGGLPA